MDIALRIDTLAPRAIYRGAFDKNDQAEFDALVWGDARPKPTWAQIQAATEPDPLLAKIESLNTFLENTGVAGLAVLAIINLLASRWGITQAAAYRAVKDEMLRIKAG